LWTNFVFAVPMHAQREALRYLRQYEEDQKQLVSWICSVGRDDITLNKKCTSKVRAVKIYCTALNHATRAVRDPVRQADTILPKAREIIAEMLSKEFGTSLYALSRDMHASYTAQANRNKNAKKVNVSN